MGRSGIFACCAVLLFTAGMWVPHAGAQSPDAMADAHVAAARAATYRPWHDYSETFATMCRPPGQANTAPTGPGRSHEPWGWYAEPAKVFDNLYYLGSSYSDNQAVWAVTTSEGIILIDSGFQYSVEGLVGDGLRKVGLDPNDIEYVIMSHAHGDRYFGGKHLKATYGARLVMSEADWDIMARSNEPAELKPSKDMVATDGMKLTLGDTTLTIYITPGHTPGTLSTLVPLKDGNATHLGYLLGGRGWSLERYGIQYYPDEEAAIRTWMASIKRFESIALREGADVFLTIHPQHDRVFERLTALKFRVPGGPHPFVGQEAIRNHTTIMIECMEAQSIWRAGR